MIDERPTVSVLVTLFNRERYLAECLQSILDCTFEDFEVIIVDDCSSDGSYQIAKRFSEQDKRFRVYTNQVNLGDYGNRKKAASLSLGKFIKYVDSDDVIYPHSLGVMVDAMQRKPRIALALAHSLPEDDQPYPWILSPTEAYQKQFLGRGCLSCGPTGAMIRRSAFEEIGGFEPKWGVLSDIDLWYRLAAKWPTALLPPGLVWWRRHEGQEYSTGDAAMRYLKNGFELTMTALSDCDCPLGQDDRATAIERAKRLHARRLLSLAIKSRDPRSAWQLYVDSKLTVRELMKGWRR